MANTYTQIHIHVIFAVKNRISLIQKQWCIFLPILRPYGTRDKKSMISTNIASLRDALSDNAAGIIEGRVPDLLVYVWQAALLPGFQYAINKFGARPFFLNKNLISYTS